METYTVEITETYVTEVEIEANNREEAYEFVWEKYHNEGTITVSDNDFWDTEIRVLTW